MLREPRLRPDMLALFEEYGLERPEPGVFIAEALNFNLAVENEERSVHTLPEVLRVRGLYGVCDSLGQLKQTPLWAMLTESSRPVAVVLTPVRKAEQPADGGWRWCKWGEYIGTQSTCAEYLYDEPTIELVYVFEAIALVEAT